MACLVAHHPSVGPAVMKLYDEGRVSDTMIREKLLLLADGDLHENVRMNLAALTKKYTGEDISLDKYSSDTWRLRYAELDGVPFDKWPKEAMDYMLNDARVTHEVWKAQNADGMLVNEAEQCRAAFALHLISAWGMVTDKEAVAKLKAEVQADLDSTTVELV